VTPPPAEWDQCPVAASPACPHTGAMQLLRIGLVVALAAVAIFVAVDSAAARSLKDGRGEVRVAGSCSGTTTSKLRLRARDGALELEFELEHSRPRALWYIAIVHERRVVWRGTRRASIAGAAFELDRRLPDLVGPDSVTVTAWGPAGATCRATAVLRSASG
jgi:hypothetical protein